MYRIYRFMYGLVGFSRSQTNGFLIFLPLMLIALFSEPLFSRFAAEGMQAHPDDIARLDSIMMSLITKDVSEADTSTVRSPVDPNTASLDDLMRLGLKRDLASRIINYRSKGGKFREKNDMLRIWGMDSLQFDGIRSMIALPEKAPVRELVNTEKPPKIAFRRNEAVSSGTVHRTDINLADTASLKKIYGIGDKLALRILKFRDALGGFVSMSQLKDVYKLDTAVINRIERQYFIDEKFVPRQLDVNKAGQQELATHPYLSSRVAHAIVAYRLNHGEFRTIEELRKIPAIDSAMFQKTLPYLKLDTQE